MTPLQAARATPVPQRCTRCGVLVEWYEEWLTQGHEVAEFLRLPYKEDRDE